MRIFIRSEKDGAKIYGNVTSIDLEQCLDQVQRQTWQAGHIRRL